MRVKLKQRWKFKAEGESFTYVVEIVKITPTVDGVCKQVEGRTSGERPKVQDPVYAVCIKPRGAMVQTSDDGIWEYLEGQDAT